VEKRPYFLLQVESVVNIGLFLNFLFSLKSITGFFGRSEDLTSNKYIIFWACKPTHGDDKLSAQVQCSHFIVKLRLSRQVENRSLFLLHVLASVNIGLFLNFLFSLKSITGFFRRSEALTSNKYIIFWACKPTHGDDKLSAQVQCSHFQQ
jgi:hypothetical protein